MTLDRRRNMKKAQTGARLLAVGAFLLFLLRGFTLLGHRLNATVRGNGFDFKEIPAGSQFGNSSALQSDNPYGLDPWIRNNDPECPYHGDAHGLFDPTVPHPRYIVTGGAGFIGSRLVARLASELGPGQVKVIDNFWRGHMSRFQMEDGSWVINPQRDLCAVDLRNEPHAMKYLRGADYVYHLADIVAGVNYVFGHQLAVFHDNVLINTNTLKASKINNIKNYIYVGTACSFPQHLQMGAGIHALHEDQTYPADPESSYGWSKLMGEYEAGLAQSPDFNVGILRFHNVYGPGSDSSAIKGQVIPSLLRKAMQYPKEPFIVWGSGSQYRDFVYVDDVVDALMLVKLKGMNKGVIQIGSGIPTTVRQLANTIVNIVGPAMNKTIEVKFDTSMPEGDRGRIAVLQRAKSILGWQPRCGIEHGLAATFSWMLKQQNQSRVLVILNGQPRGGELAWKSLHRHLLMPNNAHLATYLTPIQGRENTSMVESMAQFVWRVPEPKDGDWGVWMDMAATICPGSKQDWSSLCATDTDDKIWGGAFKKCPRHKSMSGVLLAYRWLISQKIMALNLHHQYDHIIYTRPDYLYLCDHPAPAMLAKPYIWVPRGEGYGGYTDRHLAGTSSTLLLGINITQELACNVGKYLTVGNISSVINVEQLQPFIWNRTGVAARTFFAPMFTVRASNDPTSWLYPGMAHEELSRFGLKVKYPNELASALHTCKATNISAALQAIHQHQVALF